MRPSVLFFVLMAVVGFAACNTDPADKKLRTKADFVNLLKPSQDTFFVQVDRDTVLKGKKGTMVYLPANALQFEDGKAVSGKVQISIKECYSYADMLAENLSTTNDSNLLETGGMINIMAESNGKKVKLKAGNSYVIALPKKNQKDSMQTFYGKKDSSGVVKWVSEKQKTAGYGIDEQSGAGLKEGIGENDYSGIPMDSFYSYSTVTNYYSVKFDSWKIKGTGLTVLNYLHKYMNIPDSIERRIINNGIRQKNGYFGSHFEFNINALGKIYDLNLIEGLDPAFDKVCSDFLKNLPPIEPDSVNTKTTDYVDFALGFDVNYNYDRNKFNAYFENKYASLKTSAIKKMAVSDLNFYIISATDFGWINCDHFLDTKEKKINFVVKADAQSAQLVFSDLKCIMQGRLENGNFIFPNVPVGHKVRLVAIQYKNNQPLMSSAETTVQENPFAMSGYREFTLNELKAVLGGESE